MIPGTEPRCFRDPGRLVEQDLGLGFRNSALECVSLSVSLCDLYPCSCCKLQKVLITKQPGLTLGFRVSDSELRVDSEHSGYTDGFLGKD